MQVINSLMNKCGLASIEISKMFLELEVGSRIPTVTEISKNFSLPRGTVQNAIKNLTDLGAIKLQAKGYKGTTLTEKNTRILLEIIGVTDLAGIMPFPYSKRHEGLASGLTKTLENSEIPVYIAYMRGAVKRMRMVEQGLELLDTPGILWPKFEDQQVGMRLAFIGSMNDEILIPDELACDLIGAIKELYPKALQERYAADPAGKPIEILESVAESRKCYSKGEQLDLVKASGLLIDDFRSGKLGRMTLERIDSDNE